ncbi:carbonyl reductase [NADPH] 3-like [Glandiceps talaboti]
MVVLCTRSNTHLVYVTSTMADRVALVTGGNKGIGFAIVRALCKEFDGHVYLTARNEERGRKAVKALEDEGFHPHFHQLDITSQESIKKCRDFLEEKYGGLDTLVNNAAIAYKIDSQTPFPEQAKTTIECNFFGLLNTCKTLIPLLRPHSRVVHVASSSGTTALKRMSSELANTFKSKLTESQLLALMQQFVSDAQAGIHKKTGWADTAYGVSKLGVIALASIQLEQLEGDSREDIVLNTCCPGYVDTDMTSHKGKKTIDQGAETPVYLALLPPNVKQPQGDFIRDKTIINWRQ